MALPELYSSGFRSKNILDIVEYAEAVSGMARREGNRAKAQDIDSLVFQLRKVANDIEVPGYTHAGNVAAYEMAQQAEQAATLKLTGSLIRNEAVLMIMNMTGLPYKEALEAYKSSAQGTAAVDEGSSREIKFSVTIDVPNYDSSLTLSSTVDNKGGLVGVHSIMRGDVILERYDPISDRSQP
jgi:hypothetical protein